MVDALIDESILPARGPATVSSARELRKSESGGSSTARLTVHELDIVPCRERDPQHGDRRQLPGQRSYGRASSKDAV